DAELFHKYGLNLTYARDITTDELLLVPLPVASGFSNQWQNAGSLDGRTWEVSLNVPVVSRKSLVWPSRVNWDQNRTYITRLDAPWGQRQVDWGMITTVRDSNGAEQLRKLGNSAPLWKIGWSHSLQYKRINVYALIDKTFGNHVYNEDRQWSFGDFMTSDAQQ